MATEYKIGIKIAGELEASFQNAINGAKKGVDSLGLIGKGAGALFKASAGALGAAMTGLGAFSAYSAKVGMEYESAINAAAATAGASSEEFAIMSKAAKEMGATTSMTAAESANALEYMALAGWDVGTSVKALPHVLHLAEASGTDLARTSDLVTDSMSAAGFAIEDLGHYLDVMTVAQTNSNQTTDQLMEAYIGVGGQLKNLNVPMETSATMLGLLANAGIKGSEGGTALNAILANMVKRSGDAGKAMSELGISLFDANGATRDMRDVFGDLNAALANCTEEQRATYLAMIGGKQHTDAMNALLTGLNETNEQGISTWDQLAGSITACDGAMNAFYNRKKNTLEYQINLLDSAMQALGTAFYETDMSAPLAGYVRFATGALGQLQSAFQRGGIEEMIGKFGQLVPLAINKVLQDAPRFVELSTQLVESVLDGLDQNADLLGEGAGKLIDKLAEGIVRIAPKLLTTGIHLVQAVSKGIINHLPELAEAAKEAVTYLWTSIKDYFSSLGDTLWDPNKTIADKLGAALPLIAGGVLAFGGVSQVTGGLKKFSGVLGGLGDTAKRTKKSVGGGGTSGLFSALFGKGGGLNIGATLKTVGSVSIIIGAITGLSSGLGWLANNVAGFKENLRAGAEVAAEIGNFIGSFVGGTLGGAVGAAGEMFTTHLPAMADNLADFADRMTPFFNSIGSMDMSKMEQFGSSLTQMLLVMGGNQLLTGLDRLFGGSGNSLGQFASQLTAFADQIGPAFDKLASLNQAGVENAPKVFQSLSALNAFRAGGILQFFSGHVGAGLADLASGLGSFADQIGPVFNKLAGINESGLEKAPRIFEALSALGRYEFKAGGLAQWFTGDTGFGIANLGSGLAGFAETAVPAFNKIAGIDEAGMEKAPKIFEMLSLLGGYEFKSAGLAQLVTGDTGSGLVSIANGLGAFGEVAVPAFNKIASINEAGMEKAPKIFEMLSLLGGYDFKSAGLAQLFTGDTGSGLVSIANGLGAFGEVAVPAFNKIAGINEAGMQKAPKIFEMLSLLGGHDFKAGGLVQFFTGDAGSGVANLGNGLAGFADSVAPALNKIAAIDASGIDRIGPLFDAIASIAEKFTGNIFTDFGKTSKLSSVGSELSAFAESSGSFFSMAGSLDAGAVTKMSRIFDTLGDLGASASSGNLAALSSANLGSIGSELTSLIDSLMPFFQKAASLDLGVFPKVRQMFSSLQGISDLVANANLSGGNLAAFGQELVSFIDAFAQFAAKVGSLGGSTAGLDSFIGSLSSLSSSLATVSSGVAEAVSAMTGQIDALNGAFSAVSQTVSGGMADMSGAVQSGASEISSSFSTLMSDIQNVVTTGLAAVVAAVRSAMVQFASAVRSGGQAAVQAAKSTASGIKSALSNINLSSAGSQIMNGLINGINSKKASAVQAAKNVASAVSQAMNAALKIHSPSRVTMETGRFASEGLVLGMERGQPDVAAAARELAEPITRLTREGFSLDLNEFIRPQMPAVKQSEPPVPEYIFRPVLPPPEAATLTRGDVVSAAGEILQPLIELLQGQDKWFSRLLGKISEWIVMPTPALPEGYGVPSVQLEVPQTGVDPRALQPLADILSAGQETGPDLSRFHVPDPGGRERPVAVSLAPIISTPDAPTGAVTGALSGLLTQAATLTQGTRRRDGSSAFGQMLEILEEKNAATQKAAERAPGAAPVINYSPVINVSGGSGDVQQAVANALSMDRREFERFMRKFMRDEMRLRFS